MPVLDEEDEDGDQHQSEISGLLSTVRRSSHQQDTISRSESLPRFETGSSMGSSAPWRAHSVFGYNDSNDGTVGFEATPTISQSSTLNFEGQQSSQGDQSEQPTERTRLRISLIGLREQLRASTGIINNLQTRNQVHVLETTVKEAELQRAQDERNVVWERARQDSEQGYRKTQVLMALLGLIAVGLIVYGYWCWCLGPEMSYIRQRRVAVLFE